jgi:hypothetical protein
MFSFAPQPPYSGRKSPRYSLQRRLGGPQRRFGQFLTLPGIQSRFLSRVHPNRRVHTYLSVSLCGSHFPKGTWMQTEKKSFLMLVVPLGNGYFMWELKGKCWCEIRVGVTVSCCQDWTEHWRAPSDRTRLWGSTACNIYRLPCNALSKENHLIALRHGSESKTAM